MAAAGRSISGLAYPERFYAAAAYVGFGGGSPASSGGGGVISKFQNDVALLLYGLYQQATLGPCTASKPSTWNPVELSKWTSWHGLRNMASTEAMRLFVKILEEEDPAWYSRVPESVSDPVLDVQMHKPEIEPVASVRDTFPDSKIISAENGTLMETQDKDIIVEGLGSIGKSNEWFAPSISGQRPKPRYQHGAASVQGKMYIFGGNHNGRYVSDLQVLDMKSLTWSKVEAKVATGPTESSTPGTIGPCAGHSLVSWGNKLLSIAGHTKDPSETVTVKEFDLQTSTWSNLKTYGKAPNSRGGQSVTLVGTTLVMFGGEDAKRTLLNDLHILDLETMTWDDMDTIGVPPSPRSDHTSACHADRYLYIFGGGSHATCFNDLHVLDLQSMEWSRPKQQGLTPAPRAGHAGTTIGENWYIVGGGNNKTGVSETLILNMSTLVWSVATSVEGRVPLASEGLSLVLCSYNGEDVIVSFGGYNGRYNNEVYVMKPSRKTGSNSVMDGQASSNITSLPSTTNANGIIEHDHKTSQQGTIREIMMDKVDSKPQTLGSDEKSEQLLLALKAEKEELEATLSKEHLHTLQLRQELAEAEARKLELTNELQSVRSQLAAEQSRCFKLEVDVAELRQKLQSLETLQKEVELLQRQKAASEQAALTAKQKQGSSGVWGWLAGTPGDKSTDSL